MRFLPLFIALLSGAIFISCNSKEKDNNNFPVHSFIRSQVASADSSLLALRKIIFTSDSTQDTIYFPREDFRKEAKEFLELPDLTSKEYAGRYQETTNYDADLNRLIIYQLPVDPQKELIQRQELLVQPGSSNDQIRTVIINTSEVSKDSSIERKMIWTVDQSFQVTRIRLIPGSPEHIYTYRVEWNINE